MFLVYAVLGAASDKFKDEGIAGGFVTAVVPADDIRTAFDAGEHALRKDGYAVVDIDKALQFDPDEWEHDQEVTRSAEQTAEDGEN